jgi:hypothetical protein
MGTLLGNTPFVFGSIPLPEMEGQKKFVFL